MTQRSRKHEKLFCCTLFGFSHTFHGQTRLFGIFALRAQGVNSEKRRPMLHHLLLKTYCICQLTSLPIWSFPVVLINHSIQFKSQNSRFRPRPQNLDLLTSGDLIIGLICMINTSKCRPDQDKHFEGSHVGIDQFLKEICSFKFPLPHFLGSHCNPG